VHTPTLREHLRRRVTGAAAPTSAQPEPDDGPDDTDRTTA
jgi:hypothetical protein